MDYTVQNWVSRPNVYDFRHPTWTYHKVFEKSLKNAGKNFPPHFVVWFRTRSQFSSACKKQREISINRVQNWVSLPNINDFRQGKNQWKNYFIPTLVFDSKARSQFSSACKKSERNLPLRKFVVWVHSRISQYLLVKSWFSLEILKLKTGI